MEERLQKVLAQAGVASRRGSEDLIVQGRVQVNGQVITELGTKVRPEDVIWVDGEPVSRERLVYFLLHKPAGVLSTAKDTHGRRTVLDLLPPMPERLYPVGRLDLDSEGLILLTNDGPLTHALLHPRFHVPKTYHVWVWGELTPQRLEQLSSGVLLEDGMTLPAQVCPRGRDSFEMVLAEGRKRQIRRMCLALDLRVRRLVRVKFGPIEIGDLPSGEARNLSPGEVQALYLAAGLERSDVVDPHRSHRGGSGRTDGRGHRR